MKLLGALVLLGSSTVFLNQAAAEPFNERGPLWPEAAPIRTGISHQPLPAEPASFKDRGVLWSEAAPTGTGVPRQPVESDINGFNSRDPFYFQRVQ